MAIKSVLTYILCAFFTVVISVTALAQGTSVMRAQNLPMEASNLGWGGNVSFSSEQTRDEFARPYWGLGAEAIYTLRDTTTFSVSLGFSSPYAEEDADPTLVQGVDDISGAWAESRIWTNDRFGSLGSKIGLSLPTSEISRRQSKIFTSTYDLTLATPLRGVLRKVTLLSKVGARISSYKYDYAGARGSDSLGTTFNSPFGLTAGLGASLNLGWGLSWVNIYSRGQRYDYGYVWTPSQKYVSSLSYGATDHLAFSATYQWADRIFSNDPLFTDRKSSITGEMSYEF